MKQQKIYISGQVTGNPTYGIDFMTASAITHKAMPKALVVNPIYFCAPHWSWLRCMILCIWHLIPCTTIAMIDGWQQSRGAKIELAVAILLRKQIHSISLPGDGKYYPYKR